MISPSPFSPRFSMWLHSRITWGRFLKSSSTAHARLITSEPLGLGPRHHYFVFNSLGDYNLQSRLRTTVFLQKWRFLSVATACLGFEWTANSSCQHRHVILHSYMQSFWGQDVCSLSAGWNILELKEGLSLEINSQIYPWLPWAYLLSSLCLSYLLRKLSICNNSNYTTR